MEVGKAISKKVSHDGELMPSLANRLKVIPAIRKWEADIVIAPWPNDYHPDHRYTGILVQDAAYMVIVPNVAPEVPPLKKNPIFLYSEDGFQKPSAFEPDIAINIYAVFEQKIYAMSAHESQYFDWLPRTSGNLDKVPKEEEARLDFLAKRLNFSPNEAMLRSLKKRYGDQAAAA